MKKLLALIGTIGLVGCGGEDIPRPNPQGEAPQVLGAPTAEGKTLPPGTQYQCQTEFDCGGDNTCCFGSSYSWDECDWGYCAAGDGSTEWAYRCWTATCWPVNCSGACGDTSGGTCYNPGFSCG
jgi:hypothetical protein